ncbi:NAD(P)H-dependent oxidoreductase subunit E [Euzebya tangerina]|uniref:NAD(P)H-dependent oxidoreductase subunit E n=1 Tax=Euzebya tangerina TaxID=591198 RepID=UPI000E30DD9C|nr:NAD(P)H-dependent oxidoreductase subunit E [Euzebya tangerina]
MDLTFSDAEPTAAERAVIDGLLGAPDSVWTGAEQRSEQDLRVARTGRSRERRDELLPAFDAVQSAIGWISEGALMHICRQLGVPPAEAYGVATFYELLSVTEQPPRVLHVCDDVGCRGFGGTELIAGVEEHFGPEGAVVQTSDGESATWHRSPCIGQCDRAPACYAQLAGTDDAVLVETGTDEAVAVLTGSSPGGAPDVLPPQVEGMRLLRRVGVVDPTDLDAYRDAGGYAALRRAVELGPDRVIEEVKASGLRGRGGAAFPAHVKWSAVAAHAEGPRYLICNADESEPGTFKDRTIMEGDPFALIEAMTIAGFAVGAEQGYIYIRGEYPIATARLRGAMQAARTAGMLGEDVLGEGFSFDIDLRRGQGAYICGEETALMNSIEGYRGEPRSKPPFPTDVGLFGRPTVVNNVETLVNVLPILEEGGAAFARIGTDDSTGTRLFCLSGAVDTPGVYEVESGMILRDLISLAGGEPAQVSAVLLGGAAGAFVGPGDLDLPLTFEDARSAGLGLGSGVVMVFGPSADLGDATTRIARFFRDESCGQCVPCRVGTVRVEEALGRFLAAGPRANGAGTRERRLIEELDLVMKDASICGLGHTAGTAIRSALDLGLLGKSEVPA